MKRNNKLEWATDTNTEFLKEENQMAERYLKCSTPLVVREMQIKITLWNQCDFRKMGIDIPQDPARQYSGINPKNI